MFSLNTNVPFEMTSDFFQNAAAALLKHQRTPISAGKENRVSIVQEKKKKKKKKKKS